MQTSISPILLFAGILALIALTIAFRMRPSKQSRIGFIIAVSPPLLMLLLFYSLAIHMHQSLGGWPAAIGDGGFPAALATHGSIAMSYFYILLMGSIVAWPIAYLLCALIQGLRVCVYYLGVYAFSFIVCFGAILLAPSRFLNWWWD